MPLDRLVLIIVCVIAAAGGTIWLAAFVTATFQLPGIGLWLILPIALFVYLVWRVIADRIGNSEDDHYDRIEK